jgi:phage gp29-like protein
MVQILDAYGRPIDRKALVQEREGPTLTGVRSPMSGYPADGLNPVRLAAILREADQGDPVRYLELAEQIEERDCIISASSAPANGRWRSSRRRWMRQAMPPPMSRRRTGSAPG